MLSFFKFYNYIIFLNNKYKYILTLLKFLLGLVTFKNKLFTKTNTIHLLELLKITPSELFLTGHRGQKIIKARTFIF